MDLRDTRLPYGEPREFRYSVIKRGGDAPAGLDVTVLYHLLDETRRRKTGYNNVGPIAYPIYHEQIQLDVWN